MIDLVVPKRNEAAFVKMAEKLGYASLCLAYPYKGKADFEKKQKSVAQLAKKSKIILFTALIASSKNYHEAKNLADVVLVSGEEDNRFLLEKIRPEVIFSIEHAERKDYTYSRNSGINNITAKIAGKNGTVVAYALDSLISPIALGRAKQNIRLCRKYKIKEAVFSLAKTPYAMRNPWDLISYFTILGMSPGTAKRSLTMLLDKIEEIKEKRSPSYLGEGIKIVE